VRTTRFILHTLHPNKGIRACRSFPLMIGSRSIKVIVLASGQLLTMLMAIISSAVLSRIFIKGDYATYRQTLLCYSFAAPFLILGIDRALYYFLPMNPQRSRGVLVENLILLGLGGAFFSIALICGGNILIAHWFHNPHLAQTLLILAPYPLLMFSASSLSACLVARNQIFRVPIYNILSRLAVLLMTVLPCLLWRDPSIAIIGTVLGTSAMSLLAFWMMFSACKDGDWRPSISGLRNQFAYSIPLGLASITGAIYFSMDKVIVAAMVTKEDFAVYVNGAFELPLISIVIGAVTSVLLVEYTTLFREGKNKVILSLMHSANIKCALLLLPAMFLCFGIAPELMQLLYGKQYTASSLPFRVYLLIVPMRTVSFGTLLMAAGKTRQVAIGNLISVLSTALFTVPLVLFFGFIGAAVAMIVGSYIFELIYYLYLLQKHFSCSLISLFPWERLWKITWSSAGGLAALMVIKALAKVESNVLTLILCILVFCLVTLSLLVYNKLLDIRDIGNLYLRIKQRGVFPCDL
jgi:O-antigen/teichoic acid export membrane protein